MVVVPEVVELVLAALGEDVVVVDVDVLVVAAGRDVEDVEDVEEVVTVVLVAVVVPGGATAA